MKKMTAVTIILAVCVWFAPLSAFGKEAGKAPAPVTEKGLTAIERAASANKYLFIFFFKAENENALSVQKVVEYFKGEDENTRNMRKVFETTVTKVKDKTDSISVNINDPAEKGIVNKFKVINAPMPLVLVLTPNGVITGGFPAPFNQDTLLNAFASPVQEKALKALQESKLVFLCVQNNSTKSNDVAMQGVRDFKNDARFIKGTEIITIDPADTKEAKFLKIWDINSKQGEAMTLFIAPPGSTIGMFTGATDKKSLEATLQKAQQSAGSKCCPTSGDSANKTNCAPKK